MPSTLSVRSTSNSSPRRAVTHDVGEKLKSALSSVLTNDTNDNLNALTSSISSELKQNGVGNTRFVGQLLFAFRGVQQGVPGDLKSFKQAVSMAQAAGALGPRGAAALLAKVGAVADQQDARSRVENSMLNVKNQTPARKPFESVFEQPLLKGTSYEYKPADVFKPRASVKKAPVLKPEPKPEASPAVERALSSLEVTTKNMAEGPVKASLEAVQSSLELVKVAQTKGDAVAVTRAIADLSGKTFNLVGTLVKSFGQNPALAEQAAGQLGKIAAVLGKVGGPVKALDNASKIITGKTLGGTPVDANGRADAVYDLISSALPAPVQVGMAIGKAELEALYNHIGVPVHRSIEEYGLKRLFGNRSPEQMKSLISGLSTDAPNANATVRKLLSIFPNATSGFSQATANGLWREYMATEMKSDSEWLTAMVKQDPRKPNAVPDDLREVVAQRMKDAALRFVDNQVREAKGSW